MSLIRNGFRKAGQYVTNHPMIVGLAGAGGVLGAADVLKELSQEEQELVLGAAVEAERGGGGEILGMSSATLIGAAAVLEIMESEDDENRASSSNINAADDMASDARVKVIVNEQRKSTPRKR